MFVSVIDFLIFVRGKEKIYVLSISAANDFGNATAGSFINECSLSVEYLLVEAGSTIP